MGRPTNRLSRKAVEARKRPGYSCDGGGLYLQTSASRSKSWIFRYARNRKTREMGLGSLDTVSLAQARQKAAEARKLLADGLDPIEARTAQRIAEDADRAKAITFAKCCEQYIAAHRAGWKNAKHAAQWTATLDTYANPVFGMLPVAKVETAHVLRALEAIWTEKHETANRLRSRIERVLDWAATRGYRQGDNPARWRGHLQNLLPRIEKRRRVRHHPALPYGQIGKFMATLRTQSGTAARALEFAILTAARTSEAINAAPDEFDLKAALWTIPPRRMKAGREHRVPLSARAVAIIREQIEQGHVHVFAGMRESSPLSNMAMLQLLKRMGRDDLTVHGFRASFRDWCAEATGYPREVCELALAHTIGDRVEAAYRRGDLFEKRRKLMNEWARFCDQRQQGKVLPIRGKRA